MVTQVFIFVETVFCVLYGNIIIIISTQFAFKLFLKFRNVFI